MEHVGNILSLVEALLQCSLKVLPLVTEIKLKFGVIKKEKKKHSL